METNIFVRFVESISFMGTCVLEENKLSKTLEDGLSDGGSSVVGGLLDEEEIR